MAETLTITRFLVCRVVIVLARLVDGRDVKVFVDRFGEQWVIVLARLVDGRDLTNSLVVRTIVDG